MSSHADFLGSFPDKWIYFNHFYYYDSFHYFHDLNNVIDKKIYKKNESVKNIMTLNTTSLVLWVINAIKQKVLKKFIKLYLNRSRQCDTLRTLIPLY